MKLKVIPSPGYSVQLYPRNAKLQPLLAVTLLISLLISISHIEIRRAAAHSHITFTDATRTTAWGPAVHFIADVGWVSGYSGSDCTNSGVNPPCFLPNNGATRGHVSKMVVNAKLTEGITLQNPPVPTFADVPTSHIFYREIETMYYYGWISGYTNPICSQWGVGSPCFLPSNTTTRGQFSKIIVNAMNPIRARITPPTPTFSDVPYGSTFYTFVETAWSYFIILDRGGGYSNTNPVFRVNESIARGDVAVALFHTTPVELNFGHNSRYAGSNNWDGPNTNCSPTAGGGQATFLPGVELGYSTDYGGYAKFRPMGREVLFDSDADNYHACNTTYKLAIVFHAQDSFGSGTGCQDGTYTDAFSSLPRPTGLQIKNACVQWWGSDYSEARIYTSVPQNLLSNSAQYFGTIDWSPNDWWAVSDGQLNIDNYQLDGGLNALYNDNMQKVCYTKGSASTSRTGVKYGVFPCP